MLHHQREEAATEPVAVVSFDDSNWFVAAGLFVEDIVALAEETAVRPHTQIGGVSLWHVRCPAVSLVGFCCLS